MFGCRLSKRLLFGQWHFFRLIVLEGFNGFRDFELVP
jgi:hypothetical protein